MRSYLRDHITVMHDFALIFSIQPVTQSTSRSETRRYMVQYLPPILIYHAYQDNADYMTHRFKKRAILGVDDCNGMPLSTMAVKACQTSSCNIGCLPLFFSFQQQNELRNAADGNKGGRSRIFRDYFVFRGRTIFPSEASTFMARHGSKNFVVWWGHIITFLRIEQPVCRGQLAVILTARENLTGMNNCPEKSIIEEIHNFAAAQVAL